MPIIRPTTDMAAVMGPIRAGGAFFAMGLLSIWASDSV